MATKNKGFLLDTHIFIWWMIKSHHLPKKIYDLVTSTPIPIYVSHASIWEIILKREKKRLDVPKDVEGSMKAAGFDPFPIEISHLLAIEKLPQHHKDPFDRLLIAQAQSESFTLISSDPKIWKYNVPLIKV